MARAWLDRGRPRTVEFEQEELVRAVPGGAVVTVEGRAAAPGDPRDVRFTAFAVARYDVTARGYTPGGRTRRAAVEGDIWRQTDLAAARGLRAAVRDAIGGQADVPIGAAAGWLSIRRLPWPVYL